jgi:phage gp16-like protein
MEPYDVKFAKIKVKRLPSEKLRDLARLLNVTKASEMDDETLRKAVEKKQREILSAHGIRTPIQNPGL